MILVCGVRKLLIQRLPDDMYLVGTLLTGIITSYSKTIKFLLSKYLPYLFTNIINLIKSLHGFNRYFTSDFDP